MANRSSSSEIKRPSTLQWLKLAILTVALQVMLLFVVVPGLGARLKALYNEDQFADGYDLLADNLIDGHGYRFYPDTARTLMREPGYPVFLAGLRFVFGRSVTVVKISNMVLALCTAWLTFLIVRRLVPDPQGSGSTLLLVAPLIYLFSPGTLIAECRGGMEILFGFLIAVYILTVFRCAESNRLRDYLVSGGILGFIVMVRSTPMLFPVFLLVYLLCRSERQISRLAICRNIAAMVLAMITVMSPWIARNYMLTGKFVPTASVIGISAQAGQYINTHLFEGRPLWLLDREASRERDKLAANLGLAFEDGAQGYYQTFYRSGDEIIFSNVLLGQVISEYKKSPWLFFRCLAQNAFNFWFGGKTPVSTFANMAAQLPYLVLAGMGIAYGMKGKQAWFVGLLVLVIIYIWAVHIPILAQVRYSVPLIPLLSCLGASGVIAIRGRVTGANVTSDASLAVSQQYHPSTAGVGRR